jgi:hypothetical protein
MKSIDVKKERGEIRKSTRGKMCQIYTIEYIWPLRRIKDMSFVGKWMEVEIIMLRKISQTQKDKYCMFSLFMFRI